MVVQIRHDIYLIGSGYPVSTSKVESPMKSVSLTMTTLSELGHDIVDFSVANCKEKRIYLTGGLDRTASITLDTAHFYSIVRDRWYEVRQMNESRKLHSSCCLGPFLYVFAGHKGKD